MLIQSKKPVEGEGSTVFLPAQTGAKSAGFGNVERSGLLDQPIVRHIDLHGIGHGSEWVQRVTNGYALGPAYRDHRLSGISVQRDCRGQQSNGDALPAGHCFEWQLHGHCERKFGIFSALDCADIEDQRNAGFQYCAVPQCDNGYPWNIQLKLQRFYNRSERLQRFGAGYAQRPACRDHDFAGISF